jgi:hypothetical protein
MDLNRTAQLNDQLWKGLESRTILEHCYGFDTPNRILFAVAVELQRRGDATEHHKATFVAEFDKILRRYVSDTPLYIAVVRDVIIYFERLEKHFRLQTFHRPPHLQNNTSIIGVPTQRRAAEVCRDYALYAESLLAHMKTETAQQEIMPAIKESAIAEPVLDSMGNTIGCVIHGRLYWLCTKSDIGRICNYMKDNSLISIGGTELARKAARFLPENARGATDEKTVESIRTAINNAAKEDRQATKLDLKSSVEAVLKYW